MACEGVIPTDSCLLIACIFKRIIVKYSIFILCVYKVHHITLDLQRHLAATSKHRNDNS